MKNFRRLVLVEQSLVAYGLKLKDTEALSGVKFSFQKKDLNLK